MMAEPRVTHYPSGVSYCEDCGYKLILMDDDTHTREECEAGSPLRDKR